ncbi:Fibrinogen C domain-containing protein 1-A [Amphibalanus amphitrite]|uniref:Fibrinogen C domain-containing protein 1-A n=1 Tax=Amphibalanus amphitrite TaxID=1232801 RepID=A0A6A4VVS8_AMPAM|nr:Fibrinogen C domain-containing protein 1-A [Amphibalanus amphitrite]
MCSMAARPLSSSVCLLALLCAVCPCALADDAGAGTNDALDDLLVLINNAVRQAVDPISAELRSQRELLSDILGRLSSQDSRTDQLSLRLDQLNVRLDTGNSQSFSQLDSLRTALDSFGTRLEELAQIQQNATTRPRDCSELPSGSPSGVYTLHPGWGRRSPVEAFCDMETDGGGWTVFQRREDILPREDFYRNWAEYKDGFGDLTGEFWMGLEKLWLLTGTMGRQYELRVDLEDFDGEKRYARYKDFRISSEFDGYRVTGGNYTGNAGDSMRTHFGQKFSTRDKDQDTNSV